MGLDQVTPVPSPAPEDLHLSFPFADLSDMETAGRSDDEQATDETTADALAPIVEGDHPDPVTLSEPAYDDQGLLRWASMPAASP